MNAFLDALSAPGPAADRAGKMELYGRFIGSWALDVEKSADAGASWKRVVEFRARRM